MRGGHRRQGRPAGTRRQPCLSKANPAALLLASACSLPNQQPIYYPTYSSTMQYRPAAPPPAPHACALGSCRSGTRLWRCPALLYSSSQLSPVLSGSRVQAAARGKRAASAAAQQPGRSNGAGCAGTAASSEQPAAHHRLGAERGGHAARQRGCRPHSCECRPAVHAD